METQRRSRMPSRRVLLTLLGLIILVGLFAGAFALFGGDEQAAGEEQNYSLVRPRRGEISATVDASGAMQPRNIVQTDFATTGVVVRVRVDVGDRVRLGAELAQLDTRELELQVEQARAALAEAEAGYEQLLAGATDEEIAQAQAQVAQAQGQLRQARGAVTGQDIAAAQAALERARARLERLEAGADRNEVAAAQATLDQARATLQSQRDSLSAAKTQAQLQMQQAANALRDVQDEYSRIYWDNRQIEREIGTSSDLAQRSREQEEAALRAVQNAEQDLERARVAYEEAQQAEITGIQRAEADVRSAQSNLDDLLEGAEADELASARADVAQAEAELARLQGEERAGNVAAAQAGVASAQSSLEQLTTEPRAVDLASALAQIQRAEASLEQAELDLGKASLRAPIAGTVAEVNLKVGESPDTTQADIVLADLSGFYVDVTVDEIDVASISIDQSVDLTLDALPELPLTGLVDTISPLSNEDSGVTSYNVRISTRTDDQRVRAGMSVNADIIVDQKNDALIIPRRAVRPDDGGLLVDVPVDQALCDAEPEEWPQQLELQEIDITTGLRNEQIVEVASGDIDEQTCLYVEGFDPRLSPFGGPPPGHRRR